MRLVAWNCNEGFARDHDALLRIGADVAVLAEVPRELPAAITDATAPQWIWTGDYDRRGLAIAGYGTPLTQPWPRFGDYSHYLTAQVRDLSILGIWSCPKSPSLNRYATEVVAILEAHETLLASGNWLVCGDFNAAQALGNMARILEVTNRVGLTSLYHHTTGEEIGGESQSTYFQHRDQAKGFHIDWMFVSASVLPAVKSFAVGDWHDWVSSADDKAGLSDHAPLVVVLHT